jgi:hypothetical protein
MKKENVEWYKIDKYTRDLFPPFLEFNREVGF